MAEMKASGACRGLVRQFEGCRLAAYICPAGVPTIGVGRTRGVKMGDRCSVQQADLWLTEDLQDAEAAVSSLVKVPLSQGQFDALVSFVFNLGASAFTKSTLLKRLNAGLPVAAADEFKRWVYSGGVRLKGLVDRRAAEEAMFRAGTKVAP